MGGRYLSVRAHVQFRDGSIGTLHRVVLNPTTNCVTGLVIVRGLVPRHEHVVPVALAELISPEHIEANLFPDQWADQPEYREVEFDERVDDREHEISFQPVPVWNPMSGVYQIPRSPIPIVHRKIVEGIPANDVVIGHSSTVHNLDGVIGHVDYLLLKLECWEVTHMIVRQSPLPHHPLPHHVVIPMCWLRDVTPDEIFIQGTDLQLNQLPRSHGSILETSPCYWSVASTTTDVGIEQEIADEIAKSLAEDERTATSVIEVVYEQGVVTLYDKVPFVSSL